MELQRALLFLWWSQSSLEFLEQQQQGAEAAGVSELSGDEESQTTVKEASMRMVLILQHSQVLPKLVKLLPRSGSGQRVEDPRGEEVLL